MADPKQSTPRNADDGTAQRWQAVLNNRLPLAGGWLRKQSAELLARLSLQGDRASTRILANALDNHDDPAIRQLIRKHFESGKLPGSAVDAVWMLWAETRRPALVEMLQTIDRAAASPPSVRVLSALLLQKEAVLQNLPPDLIDPLILACHDTDTLLASRARYALSQIKNSLAVSALCVRWATTRDSLLEAALAQGAYQPDEPPATRLLVALKFNRLERVTQAGAGMTAALLAACDDRDEEIRARARFCLLNLKEPAAINELCAEWNASRSPLAAEAIAQARYVASKPPRLRLMTALKAGRLDLAGNTSPEHLPNLIEACQDPDPAMAANAAAALKALRKPQTRDELGRFAVEEENALALAICQECGYLPSLPEQRALYFFLTDRLEEYETLDFDQRLLNAVYETSGGELRQRILRKIQHAGRSDFLSILTGSDVRARAARMSAIESELLIRVLSKNRDWNRLWILAFELALSSAVEIIRILDQNHWRPEDGGEAQVFHELAELAKCEIIVTGPELDQLPIAVPCATLKVNGRVNDIAFAPDTPLLAIGTGGRRLALWNYHQGRIEKVYREFQHAIGWVAFTNDGILACSERSNTLTPCSIYIFPDGTQTWLGQHQSSVTALLPLDGRLLSAGRDGTVNVWDTQRKTSIHSRHFDTWPRSVCVSRDGKKAGLLDEVARIVALPDLRDIERYTLLRFRNHEVRKSVATSSCFLAGGERISTGYHNGQVINQGTVGPFPDSRLICTHEKAVTGVQALDRREMLVTAGAEGKIHFFRLEDDAQAGSLTIPAGRVTSLCISPDEAFMATGTGESTMILWDLRAMELPGYFSQPLAAARSSQMQVVNALSALQTFPEGVHNALLFLRCLLQRRFRYDIEISDMPSIQVGEFDVLID